MKSKFKLIGIVSVLIILFLIPLTIQASSESDNKVVKKYIVIGDEVAMESKDYYDISYASLIYNFLSSLNNDLEYKNLSEPGITSTELINIIDNNSDEIKNSDLITISIGGNNVYNVILQGLYDSLNIDKEKFVNCNEDKFDSMIFEYLNTEEIISIIQNEIDEFKRDFPSIIKKIEKLAPDSKIYVNTVYNPINKKGNVYNFFDSQIKLINNIIVENNTKYNYKIIDCYNILNDNEALNFKIDENKFQLFPNKVGHAMMATQVICDYDDYVNLKVDKITSNSDKVTGKTLPNSNIIILSDSGIIGTTQVKYNGEFELKISPMVAGTNVEILVYDEKIFSILYKFEKVIVKKELFT